MTTLEQMRQAKAAAPALKSAATEQKNAALRAMAQALCDHTADILAANAQDMDAAKGHISPVMLDRLALTEARIAAMADGVRQVAALPDPGRYTPGDSAVDDRILDAKSAYDSLTDADQRFVSDEHKNRLNTLLKKLGEYTILDGDGQTVVVGTAVALTFRASGPLDSFEGIMINGKSVSRDSYTAKSGSTIVTLNPGYVASLSVGEYALSIRYTDGGSADAHFRVIPAPSATSVPAAPNLPQTGDGSHLLLWLALTALGALGAAALLAGKRSRRE